MNRMSFSAALVLISTAIAPTGMAEAQAPSPYAGEQTREIKARSAKEIFDLAQGRGMSLAKAAELNRYPGPMNGLELAESLKLSKQQREALKAIMTRMSAEAKAVGAEVLGLERELDAGFATRMIDTQRVKALTERIGIQNGALRAVHLAAHLETATVLFTEQIVQYDLMRGYAGAPVKTPSGDHDKH
ncbi:conserved exported hypothetical protein [Bosea sp. 62]|uniref:hypothetical protein n=1 Tax=unclassified Bosea (in: a-proteobacteria) TaxID=2653178 RepID=UPI001258B86E|nr:MULTISPECIES: hypothetical protein [unclassified Bosea (in: a-proteobacteria)]CAD5271250.1 conserved exported hypothetical protein [Bosea sp. 21B]CAD5291564.1 conserved exported hypothetical protein [Bosea sp. 46]CAD5300719.1 conserved exported hypothetical protein [Bosea sp. 7B]VVT60725.1 conserved exported hypothetical protein [Bosea sp. EC-HK365B]VXC03657.1 conserved exported hypothetical protein [Bosea sp. 62]